MKKANHLWFWFPYVLRLFSAMRTLFAFNGIIIIVFYIVVRTTGLRPVPAWIHIAQQVNAQISSD